MRTEAHLNQQSSSKDIEAWMDDLLTRMLLMASMDHEVVHQDGTVEEVKVKAVGASE